MIDAHRGLRLEAIPGVPRIQPGDDLARLLGDALENRNPAPADGDVVVVAQKIVSKAEGRYVHLDEVIPSERAHRLAVEVEKDPRLVEIILGESAEVVACRPGVLVVAHRLGFVMANAGVDRSNLEPHFGRSNPGEPEERVLLLPEDPDASAAQLKAALDARFHASLGVVVNDSVGRAWRCGVVGLALGAAGLPAVRDLRGQKDLHDRALEVTFVGFADQIASAAGLVMGEGGEAIPAVLVRGLSWTEPPLPAAALVRAKEMDLFR